jgi:hypothetical protein
MWKPRDAHRPKLSVRASMVQASGSGPIFDDLWHSWIACRQIWFEAPFSESEFHEDPQTTRRRNKMPILQRIGLRKGSATFAAGSQDISTTLQGMFGQGTYWDAAPLKALAWNSSGQEWQGCWCKVAGGLMAKIITKSNTDEVAGCIAEFLAK